MLKEDLIDAVLKERLVKRNTILLALQNRKKFMRDESGKYMLLQSNQKEKQEEKNQTQIINDGQEVNSSVSDLTSTIVAEDQTGGAG
jgi:hypothetical protein